MALLLTPMSAVSNHIIEPTGQHVEPVASASQANATNKKPKLSLQTAILGNVYGSLTRGLGPNTAQTAHTPTTNNTLANTWDLSIRCSPISRTESPRPQSTKPQTSHQPYSLALPFGLRPILKNSPLANPPQLSASPRDSRRRVFFPVPKKVAFKKDLEDVIVTKEYTAQHYDLSSSEEESSPEEATPTSSGAPTPTDPTTGYTSPPPSRKRKDRRELLNSIQITEQDIGVLPDGQSRDDPPERLRWTCKRRKWQWTLGSTGNVTSTETPSEEKSSDSSSPSPPPVNVRPDDSTGTSEAAGDRDQDSETETYAARRHSASSEPLDQSPSLNSSQ